MLPISLPRLLVPLNSDIDTVHCSVKLLVGVCSKPGTLSPVSVLLTQKAGVAEELMQSLVERLETDEPETLGTLPFCKRMVLERSLMVAPLANNRCEAY